MQKRNNYTAIEDFLADESFQRWVRLHDDSQGWEDWTLENPNRAKLVEEARLWLLAMKVPEANISPETVQSALESTWKKIQLREKNKQNPSKSVVKLWQNQWFRGVAAVLVFGLFSAWYFTNEAVTKNPEVTYNKLVNENEEGLVEQTNNSDKPQVITLSDGSSVLLQPKSKLSYPKIFTGNERKVYLFGEGFFEVSKNPEKPFFVYANEIVTKVVGTSFRIKAYANQPNVEVMVRTGKVKVRSNESVTKSDKGEVVLLPNQAVRFERQNQSFNKITEISQDENLIHSIGNIEQLSFEFSDIPVSQIFKTIEEAYLVKIDFPENKLKDCHLTTSLADMPLPEKLKIICKCLGNNTNYVMNGNQITITSKGCN